jgi:hypothetical protein
MSALKPCPVLQSNDGTIRERCAKCPNRKPVSLEGLVKQIEDKDSHCADSDFECGYNDALVDAVALVRRYQKELNNG